MLATAPTGGVHPRPLTRCEPRGDAPPRTRLAAGLRSAALEDEAPPSGSERVEERAVTDRDDLEERGGSLGLTLMAIAMVLILMMRMMASMAWPVGARPASRDVSNS